MLFQISDLTVHYQKVAALKGISLGLADGDIVTLIGANGAGKSTTLRAISGLAKPSSGEISFEGRRIDGLRPEQIVALGIAHVPEGRRVFPGLTVLENLHTGAYLRRDAAAVAADLEKVFHHFPRLKERRSQSAKTLSGGEQQMLAIGRALMA
ncbi:MAG: branched-chain amino acid transport ATP-binding protein LivF, partial [Rhodospirillales bacterium]|nr:branched-chain amino acid transport ATP-binding protein LivF [Rhodospirillales bacterium]